MPCQLPTGLCYLCGPDGAAPSCLVYETNGTQYHFALRPPGYSAYYDHVDNPPYPWLILHPPAPQDACVWPQSPRRGRKRDGYVYIGPAHYISNDHGTIPGCLLLIHAQLDDDSHETIEEWLCWDCPDYCATVNPCSLLPYTWPLTDRTLRAATPCDHCACWPADPRRLIHCAAIQGPLPPLWTLTGPPNSDPILLMASTYPADPPCWLVQSRYHAEWWHHEDGEHRAMLTVEQLDPRRYRARLSWYPFVYLDQPPLSRCPYLAEWNHKPTVADLANAPWTYNTDYDYTNPPDQPARATWQASRPTLGPIIPPWDWPSAHGLIVPPPRHQNRTMPGQLLLTYKPTGEQRTLQPTVNIPPGAIDAEILYRGPTLAIDTTTDYTYAIHRSDPGRSWTLGIPGYFETYSYTGMTPTTVETASWRLTPA